MDTPAFFDDVARHVRAAQSALVVGRTLRAQNMKRNRSDGTWDFDAVVVTEGFWTVEGKSSEI